MKRQNISRPNAQDFPANLNMGLHLNGKTRGFGPHTYNFPAILNRPPRFYGKALRFELNSDVTEHIAYETWFDHRL